MLVATLYVDNPGDFVITNDADMSGTTTPTTGDTVTWNPGAGTQHPTAPVTGLTFGTNAFSTIQSAVNAATAGDTIRVAGGTFAEGVNINKQLFVLGNQVNADAQSGRSGANETIVTGAGNNGVTPFDITANDVELNGFTVEDATNGNQFGFGILIGAGTHGTLIKDDIVEDNIAGISLANNSGTDQTVITGNLIQNNNSPGSVSGTGIYTDQSNAGGALTNVLIDNNTFTNNTNAGVIIGPTDATMGASNITISRNIMTGEGNGALLFNTSNSTIANNEISSSIGSQIAIGGGDSGISIHNNIISNGATNGIRIGEFFTGATANSSLTINRNSISGNPTAGLSIDTGTYIGAPGSLDATLNWWGSSTGPTIASNPGGSGEPIVDPDAVVDYTPFLTDGTDTQPTVRGFQPVIADVGIMKTASPNPAVPGGPLTYTVVVSNNGPDTVAATVTDAFPAGFTGAAFTSTAVNATGNSNSGAGNINDAVTLQSGGSITYTVSGTISPTATGTLMNTATVTPQAGTQFDNPDNNSSTTTTQLTPQADLGITKSDGVTTAAPGSTLTYTIVVSNSGPSDVTGATVADTFAPTSFSSTSFTATEAGGATGASNSTGTGVQNITQTVNLPVGATITYVVTAHVSATAAGAITNTATVTAPAGTTETNPGNNSSTDTDTVAVTTSTADLSITKTDGSATTAPGGTVTYTIVVSNAGPSEVRGATVADLFPPMLNNPTFTATGTGSASGFSNGSGNLNQTVNLPVGATITYTVTGTVSPTAAGAISNTATISAPAGVVDANEANNVATDTDTISPTTALADLSITKSDGVSTVAPGGTLTYTIVVSNVGSSDVTGATVTDVFSPQFTSATFTASGTTGTSGFSNGTGAGVNNINQTVTIPVGGSITYVVTGTVSPNAAGAITNSASVATPAGVVDVNAANNVATDTDAVATTTSTTDLRVTKTDNVTTTAAGGALTYTIVVSNAGSSTVTGATVTDVFPPNLTGVTYTASGTTGTSGFAPTGAGNINNSVTLPAGGSITYVVNATVSSTPGGAVANTASVTAPAGVADSNPANNVATDIDTVTPLVPQTDLSITKNDAVTSVSQNGAVTYVIVVTNNGASTVTGATVNDVFPPTLTGVSYTSTGTTGTSGNTVSGTGPIHDTVTLPAGGSITYTVNATVSANATGTVSNTATVTPPATVVDVNPTNNTATDIDTVAGTPVIAALSIFKTDGVATVTPGGTTTYTIVVSNSGPDAVAGAVVADAFPATLTNITFTANETGGATGATNGANNINQTVNLPAGATITYTVNATVSPTAANGTTITNTATVTPPGGTPVSSSSDTDTVATTTTATTDLSVFKTDGSGTAVAGQNITYTILVSNLGATAVTGATLTDIVPANTTFVSFTAPAGWTSATPTVGGTGTITTTNSAALASGATATFTLVVAVNAGASGAVTNTAAISAPTGTADTNPANNVSTDTDQLIATPNATQVDLSINKSDSLTTATPGGPITYTITVSNSAASPTVTGATVTDIFPPNFTGVTYTATGTTGTSGFSGGSGNINQTVTIPGGGSITYTVTGTVSANATGAIENTATVIPPANVTDTNLANNSSTDIDTLTPAADLSITKTDNKTVATPGAANTYTIVVTNNGPSDVTGATVSDTFPGTFTGGSFTATGTGGANGFSNSSGNINQTVNLPAGATITYVVSGTVSPSATGTLDNTATVTAPNGTTEVNTQNNMATDTDTLTAQADLSISKSDTPDPVIAGSNITYTITVNSTGPSDAQNVVLSDTVPGNTTFVSFTAPPGWSNTTPAGGGTGPVTSTITTLPAGSSPQTFVLVVNVNPGTSAGTTITNTATITSTTDTNPNNNTATATTTVQVEMADVSVTKTGPDTAAPGDNVTYTVSVRNNGPNAAQNVDLTDVIPDNTTFVSAMQTSGTTFMLVSPPGGGTGTFTADAPSLASGATATFIIVVNVDNTTADGTTIENTANVTTTTAETNTGNNSATVDTDVETPQGLPECDIFTANEEGDFGTAEIVDDADNPGTNALVITGTNRNDVIVVEKQPKSQSGMFRVVQNKHVIVTFIPNSVSRIVIFGEGGNDSIVVSPLLRQQAIIFGGSGNDVIAAGSGDTQVSGGDGNDKIVGGRGNDTLCGDNGNDVIVGGLGNDVIFGEAGNDVINGGLGDDLLLGGDGNDVIDGALGNDHLYGQAGNDTLIGGFGNNIVVGGDGNDKLVARPGRNILIGGNGADTITGSAGDDIEIAGSTAYDENDDALQAILNEWSSRNSYSTRVSNIRNGTGANAPFVLDDTTVFDDGVRDTLIGSAGTDWFWIGFNDRIKDRARNEQVN